MKKYLITEEELKELLTTLKVKTEQAEVISKWFMKDKQPVELAACIDTPDDNNHLYLRELNEIGQTRRSQLCKIGKGYQRIFIQEEKP